MPEIVYIISLHVHGNSNMHATHPCTPNPSHPCTPGPPCPCTFDPQVSRVEENVVYIEFEYEGKSHTARLERDEAKVQAQPFSVSVSVLPSLALAADQPQYSQHQQAGCVCRSCCLDSHTSKIRFVLPHAHCTPCIRHSP